LQKLLIFYRLVILLLLKYFKEENYAIFSFLAFEEEELCTPSERLTFGRKGIILNTILLFAGTEASCFWKTDILRRESDSVSEIPAY
jgi:hypothetical protein